MVWRVTYPRKQTNKQTNRQTNKRTSKQNEQTTKRANTQTNKQTNKQTNRQTDKQTTKQTDETTRKQQHRANKQTEQGQAQTDQQNRESSAWCEAVSPKLCITYAITKAMGSGNSTHTHTKRGKEIIHAAQIPIYKHPIPQPCKASMQQEGIAVHTRAGF